MNFFLSGFKKHDLTIYRLQKTHIRSKDRKRLKVKEWNKIFHTNSNQKRIYIAILISEKNRL